MKIYDLSLTIRPDLPVWPGDPGVIIQRRASIEQGDVANVSHLALGAHAGTHLEAPLHFIEGRTAVEELDLDVLIGPAYVVEFDVEKTITAADLEAISLPDDTTRLLCKTRNSQLWVEDPTDFVTDYVHLSPDAAQWLVDHGYRLIGVDYLSVEQFEMNSQGAPTHHILLDAEIVIVEGLSLAGVPQGRYNLACLPLKIQGSDGAPCRAILTEE